MPRRTMTALTALAAAATAVLAPAATATAGTKTPTSPVLAAHYFAQQVYSDTSASGPHDPTYLPRLKTVASSDGFARFVDRASLADKNKDKRDDDARVSFRLAANGACLDLRTGTVTALACGTKKRTDKNPLRTAAVTVDHEARLFAEPYYPGATATTWDMTVLKQITGADVPAGVKVTLTDKNRDGVEDDGRIQFAKGGQKTCLTLPTSRTSKAKAKVTAGACPATARPLPLEVRRFLSERLAERIYAEDVMPAAYFEYDYVSDHPDTVGVSFTATAAKPVTVDGAQFRPATKGATVTATVKDNVGFCIQVTHPTLMGPGHAVYYDSATGAYSLTGRPSGGAC